MKWVLPLLGFSLAGYGFVGSGEDPKAQEVTVVISGGARGHLSPCGCTKPMTGGFKRLATVIRDLKSRGNVVWIDSGDIIDIPGRQSQLKAETYGELMGALGVDAVAYTTQDQRQGVGLIVAAAPLSKQKWLVPEADSSSPTTAEVKVRGLTVGASNPTAMSFDGEKASDVLLFDGPSKALSQAKQAHQIEVFASDGIPTVSGNMMSPGSNLRGVVIATFRDGKYVSARVELLEPSIKDDPKADKIYRNYLTRVTQERLIDKVAKEANDDYSGSKSCISCHGKIYTQFSQTKHAHAYQSLVKEQHQADPDCVSCHVVGMNSTKGFIYERTPSLAQVGCESCHGAGRAHARDPKHVHLSKVAEEKCLTCHTPSNSPNFVFKEYWKKIKH